ncbi:hypothetical protein B484DRAFT_400820 [Ochromonadaceae sp. CCMP2298]|nr:hypothetical protein B484DRAFT_400820 [Ochromonadaceae sp. CCMP2298]
MASIAMREQLTHGANGGMVAALMVETDVGSGAQMEVVVEEMEEVEEDSGKASGAAERLSALQKKAEALCRIQCWCRRGTLRRRWADKQKMAKQMALRILCWWRRTRRADKASSNIRHGWVVLESSKKTAPQPSSQPSGSSSSQPMVLADEEEEATQPQPVVAERVYELKGVDESYHPFVAGAVARYVQEWQSAECLRGILKQKAFNLTKKTKTAKKFVAPTEDVKCSINDTGFAACVRCLNEKPDCLFGEVVVNGRNGKEMLNHRKGGACAAKLAVTYIATGEPSKKRLTRTTPTEVVADLKLGTDWIYFDFPGLQGGLYKSSGKDMRSAATTAVFDWNVGGAGANSLPGWYHVSRLQEKPDDPENFERPISREDALTYLESGTLNMRRFLQRTIKKQRKEYDKQVAEAAAAAAAAALAAKEEALHTSRGEEAAETSSDGN